MLQRFAGYVPAMPERERPDLVKSEDTTRAYTPAETACHKALSKPTGYPWSQDMGRVVYYA